MKKVILILLIIALTGVLCFEIYKYTKENKAVEVEVINETQENADKVDIKPTVKSNEKTIDLYGTFTENDLVINTIKMTFEGKTNKSDVFQISGLKNKEIENKINSDIVERIKKYLSEANKDEGIYCHLYEVANFGNVFSFSVNNEHGGLWGLNYNLTTGQYLTFEDLFKKNEDLKSIVQKIFYIGMVNKIRDQGMYEGMGYDEPYYDTEKGGWYAKYYWYENNGETRREEIRQYVLPIDEYEIEKYTKKFLKDENKNFCFTPSELIIFFDGESYRIPFKEIADSVVIYDKFLTNESIFERDDVGAESLITCTAEYNYGIYKETKYESDNFFYDISIYPDYETKDKLTRKAEVVNQLKDKVNQYKEESIKNKNKAYFLFVEINYNIKNGVLSTELKEKNIICDISEREKCLEQILNRYRYYNLVMYGTIYSFITNFTEVHNQALDFKVTESKESKKYDSVEESINVDETNDEILPSSTRKIEASEIADMDYEKLYLAYNEIFARHGHDFKTQKYIDYFSSKSWYSRIEGKVVSLDELSEIEQYNANLLKTTADSKN